MQTKVFAVFDSKACAYMAPFFLPSKGLAIRAFVDLATRPDSTVTKYPADFTLFELGEFEDSTGIIKALPAPISIGNALEFVASKEANSVPFPGGN